MPLLSASNLANNLSTPARSYLFNIIIANPIGGGDPDTLMLRCQSSQMPERSFKYIEVPWQQDSNLQYPGKLSYPYDWTCTFLESAEDGLTMQSFYNWANTVIQDTTAIGNIQSNIITNMELQLIDPTGAQWGQYTFLNACIERIGNVELSYGTEDIIKIPITFRYQKWVFASISE
jgi:hypothetical protein